MGGKRITEEELQQIKTFIDEGLTNREIGEKLGRSKDGIRNIRYRKGLVKKAEDESKVLFHQRDELRNRVMTLRGNKTFLAQDVSGLRKEKEKLEAIINADTGELYGVLAQALMNLKQQRPNLFILTGQDQIVSLARVFFGFVAQ